MMSETSKSLPPHLKDSIKGHLHLILLRPVLLLPLLPHQSLDFEFNWWGSDYVHCLRLPPDAHETKIIFDICCDFQGLQKYFQDAAKLEFNVVVSADQTISNDHQDPPHTIARSVRHTKYQLRKKKEWKCGDHIGKFVISNLKLNTRGEYVDENTIFNSHGDHCGSVIVFMLFADQKLISKEKTPLSAVRQATDNVLQTNIQPTHPEKTRMAKTFEFGRRLSPAKVTSPKIKHSKSKLSRDSLSPRFISFEKENKSPKKSEANHTKFRVSPKKRETNVCEVKVSPKKIGIPQYTNQKLISREPKCNQKLSTNSYNLHNWKESSLMLSSCSDPKMSFNENFILSKLFSFVDSGAIYASDLPSLIQICQGRSPSIEFDSLDFQEGNAGHDDHLDRFQEKETEPEQALQNYKNDSCSMFNKDKKPVNISGISYRSDLWPAEPPKVKRVFDDHFLASLLSKEEEGPDLVSKAFEKEDSKEAYTCHRSPNIDNSQSDTSSLLILGFHSIQFNNKQLKDPTEKNPDGKGAKKKPVRQRSKLCYFVEVFLEYEGMEEPFASSLYISRQVGDGEVTFGSRQIFQLLKQTEHQENEGFLKFRVSRRRLGNRLREGVGVGIVSLTQLQVSNEELSVVLPLWAWSCSTQPSIRKTERDPIKQEMPLGSLHLSAIVALASESNNIDCEDEREKKVATPMAQITTQSSHCTINDVFTHASPPQRLHKVEADIYCEKEGSTEPPSNATRHHQLHGLSNNSSFFIEHTSSNVNFIPFKEEEEVDCERLQQEVHLEVLEGNGLPLLRSKRTLQTFPPSSYVQTTVSEVSYRTQVEQCTSSPKWKFAADFELSPSDLKDTNLHLILKVLHCLDGSHPHQDDAMLGFATIKTQFLWDSFLSVCGWIPVLSLEGEVCGEIKVSLTPKRSRSWYNCLNENVNLNRKSQDDHPTEKGLEKIFQSKVVTESHQSETPLVNSENKTVSNVRSTPFLEPEGELKLNKSVCFAATPEHSNVTCMNQSPEYERQIAALPLPLQNETEPFVDSPKQSENVQKHPSKRENDVGRDEPRVTYDQDVMEGMQWLNNLRSLDTPCVSYLDLNQPPTTVMSAKIPSKRRRKKNNRIAANFNFLPKE